MLLIPYWMNSIISYGIDSMLLISDCIDSVLLMPYWMSNFRTGGASFHPVVTVSQ